MELKNYAVSSWGVPVVDELFWGRALVKFQGLIGAAKKCLRITGGLKLPQIQSKLQTVGTQEGVGY